MRTFVCCICSVRMLTLHHKHSVTSRIWIILRSDMARIMMFTFRFLKKASFLYPIFFFPEKQISHLIYIHFSPLYTRPFVINNCIQYFLLPQHPIKKATIVAFLPWLKYIYIFLRKWELKVSVLVHEIRPRSVLFPRK